MSTNQQVAYVLLLATVAFGAGWFVGLDYAAVSCLQDMEFSSEGIRYVCMQMPGTVSDLEEQQP